MSNTKIIVGGILEKDGKYLLVQEKQEKCYGKWNFPAGHLDPNENIFEGAIREIFEETGCTTKLTGILEIANRKAQNEVFLGIIFSTEIIEENITINSSEILDVKWFSYEEILEMKNELRSYEFITNAVIAHKKNNILPLDLIKMIK